MFRVALLSLTIAGVHLLGAGPGAAATSGAVRDGRDSKGKLDVASVSYSRRAADRSLTHTVHFYSPVAARSFTAKGNMLAFAFDTDGNKSADRLAVVLWSSGALRGGVVDSKGRFLALARVRRPNSRTIAVTIPGPALDQQGGYRWVLLTESKDRGRCKKGCLDAVPNTGPVLFDFTAPWVDVRMPDPYFEPTTTFNLRVGVRDPGFSGLRSWRLESRTLGQTQWTTIAQGGSTPQADVPQTGIQGTSYEYRLTAVDRQGNQRSTTRLFTMPIDDANPLLADAYGGTGSWQVYVNSADAMFMKTAHLAVGADTTFTYKFTGTYVAWLSVPSGTTTVLVSIDGGLVYPLRLDGQRKPFERSDLLPGPHTLTISTVPGYPGFWVDGVISR